MKRILVLGAGGHAKMVVELIGEVGEYSIAGLLDPDRSLWGKGLLGAPVLGGDDLMRGLLDDGVGYALVGVGSVGDNSRRKALFEALVRCGFSLPCLVHPKAAVSRSAVLGPGTVVMQGGVVGADARVGSNCIVNSGAIVEHDCRVADHVHVASGAVLASTVTVGEAAHIGAGATVRQLIRIGARAVIGAGAAVVKDVGPDVTAVGVPARPIPR